MRRETRGQGPEVNLVAEADLVAVPGRIHRMIVTIEEAEEGMEREEGGGLIPHHTAEVEADRTPAIPHVAEATHVHTADLHQGVAAEAITGHHPDPVIVVTPLIALTQGHDLDQGHLGILGLYSQSMLRLELLIWAEERKRRKISR